MRRLLVCALILLAAVASAPSVQAHARPVTISPSAGAQLASAPAEVRIEFSEAINAKGTRIEITTADGTPVEIGPVRVDPRTTAKVAVVTNATDEGFLVRWSTYSLVDGHRMAGSWGFAVGNATPPQSFEEVRSPLAVSTVAARAMAYVGLVGLAAITWLTRSATYQPPRLVNPTAASVALLFLGSAFLFLQGASVTGDFFQDDYTRRVVWQVVIALALGLTVGLRAGPVAAALRSLLLIAWAIVQGFSSHAAAALGPLGALIDTIHLCFVVLWIGVVAAVWLDRREGADFVAHAKAVGKVAAASVTGALLTGVALFLSLTVLADRAITGLPTTYALTLVYKLVGVAALLGFGAVNQFVHLRRLGPDPTREGLLRANLRRELVNALVVLLLAAILSTLDPQLS